jgi:hypothetical protein
MICSKSQRSLFYYFAKRKSTFHTLGGNIEDAANGAASGTATTVIP